MNLFLETLRFILYFFYYMLEGIFLVFVPSRYRRKDVKGQRVLITGAGSGLGRLMAIQFGKLGCTVVILDINEDGNEETANQVREFGVPVHTYVCDLSKREDIYRTAEKVKKDVGDIDILVNNAGIVTGRKILQADDKMMQKTMEVNVMAHFWTVKSFLPAMLARNRGHIVTIASVAGYGGISGLADYTASKFGAVGFDESLRSELSVLKKTGVKTTCICPFYIDTGMFAGVSTRFPSVMPILKPDMVVDRIMNAILSNQPLLFIPRDLYFFMALKNLVPVKCFMLLNDFFDTSNSMEEFRGRMKQQ